MRLRGNSDQGRATDLPRHVEPDVLLRQDDGISQRVAAVADAEAGLPVRVPGAAMPSRRADGPDESPLRRIDAPLPEFRHATSGRCHEAGRTLDVGDRRAASRCWATSLSAAVGTARPVGATMDVFQKRGRAILVYPGK